MTSGFFYIFLKIQLVRNFLKLLIYCKRFVKCVSEVMEAKLAELRASELSSSISDGFEDLIVFNLLAGI